MPRRRLQNQRLIAVFLLGVAAFNYPVVAIFDRVGWLAGWPAQFVWLMVCWASLIGLLTRFSRDTREGQGGDRR